MHSVFKWVFFASVLACGAPEDVEQTEPEYSAESDIGELEQPIITLPNGYGVLSKQTPQGTAQNRCFTSSSQPKWPGGQCQVPFMRAANIVEDTGSCNVGTYAADYSAGMLAASTHIRAKLADAGWTVYRNNPIPDRQHPAVNITLNCGNPFSGSSSTSLGGTSISVAFPNCSNSTAGELCPYSQVSSRMYRTRVEVIAGFTSWTSVQRRTAVRNLFAHEAGHGVGLGHDSCGSDPLTQLMGNAACMDFSQPVTFGNKNLNATEIGWLRDYRP